MSNNFLYQINWNRNKYPEICAALDDARDGNGVAWYLRELIQRDINEKKAGVAYAAPVQSSKPEPRPEPRSEKKKVEELPDESGGFL